MHSGKWEQVGGARIVSFGDQLLLLVTGAPSHNDFREPAQNIIQGSPTREVGCADLRSLAGAPRVSLTCSTSQDTYPATPQSHLVHVCGGNKSQSDQDGANMHAYTPPSTKDRPRPTWPSCQPPYVLLLWALRRPPVICRPHLNRPPQKLLHSNNSVQSE